MMKKVFLFSLLVFFALGASPVFAQKKYPLGFANLAAKVDYFRFTDSGMSDLNAENGVYFGVEGYMALLHPNIYVGLEVGWAGTSGDAEYPGIRYDVDVYYVPIELNAKYVYEIMPDFVVDVGAGVAANYFNADIDKNGVSRDADDWIFGGQVFGGLNFKMDPWFIGANLKFQYTDYIDIREFRDTRASNFRAGGQFGFMF